MADAVAQEAVTDRRRKTDEVRNQQSLDEVYLGETQPLSEIHGHHDNGEDPGDI